MAVIAWTQNTAISLNAIRRATYSNNDGLFLNVQLQVQLQQHNQIGLNT